MTKFTAVAALFLVLSPAAHPRNPADGTVEKIADGFQFVEGPVWKDSLGLLF